MAQSISSMLPPAVFVILSGRDLEIRVRCFNQLSYEATDVGSRSIIMVNNLLSFILTVTIYKYAGETTYMYTYKYYIHLTFKGSI